MSGRVQLHRSCGSVARHKSWKLTLGGPCDFRSCPTVARELSKSCPSSWALAEVRPALGRIWANSKVVWPTLASCGWIVGQASARLHDIGAGARSAVVELFLGWPVRMYFDGSQCFGPETQCVPSCAPSNSAAREPHCPRASTHSPVASTSSGPSEGASALTRAKQSGSSRSSTRSIRCPRTPCSGRASLVPCSS